MAKVTSKLQVTIPKAIARQYGIEAGDDIDFIAAGEDIRVVRPGNRRKVELSATERLRLFREATTRQRAREKKMKLPVRTGGDRGWTREELYTRGKPR
jgi:AbrB family looped-hinge helix DNA binding protein